MLVRPRDLADQMSNIRLRYLRCPLTQLDAKPARLSASLHGAAYFQSLRNGDNFPMVRLNFPSGIFRLQIEVTPRIGARNRMPPLQTLRKAATVDQRQRHG